MNYLVIISSIGFVMCIEAICMLPAVIVSLIYGGGDLLPMLYSMGITLAFGLALRLIRVSHNDIHAREGFAIVSVSWLLVGIFGALPFLFGGIFENPLDAIFEAVSSFSTTSASLIPSLEALPRGILFWRSFMHWMGGMGVLVLMLAIMPSVKANTLYIMKAESPGPSVDKFVPKVGQVAKILYTIYLALTLIEALVLFLCGMSVFDALIHAFGTASTGGCSSMDSSVGAFGSAAIEMVIAIFMLIFGINFTLHHAALKGNFRAMLRDEELRTYLIIVAISTIFVAINMHLNVYQGMGASFRHSFFQTTSFVTTTGYTTANFANWPVFSQCIMLFLMFVGACAGSTSGGFKCLRFLLLLKSGKRVVQKNIHPHSVHVVKVNGKAVSEEILSSVTLFFFAYIAIIFVAMTIVALDNKDLPTTLTAVLSSISNVGPGMGEVGASANYSGFSMLSKATLAICMMVGRLEIYPVLLLAAPSFWKR